MEYVPPLISIYSVMMLGFATMFAYFDSRSLKGGGIEPVAALIICAVFWPIFLAMGAATLLGERAERRAGQNKPATPPLRHSATLNAQIAPESRRPESRRAAK